MKPAEFKIKVHDTYKAAINSHNTWVHFGDSAHRIFHDVSVYGEDGGKDFVETNIEEIQKIILNAAKEKKNQISFEPYRFGKSAIVGMSKSINELTNLQTHISQKSVTVSWE